MSAAASSSKQPEGRPAPAEIQQQYNRFKSDLQTLAKKIGELENDVDEHQ